MDDSRTNRSQNDPPTMRGGESSYVESSDKSISNLPPSSEKDGLNSTFRGYRYVRLFPASGGEADIWLVQKGKDQFILKLYRLGIEPKLHVLEKVSEISKRNSKHLISILDFGYDEESGRWFEILEYARYGSLKDLIKEHEIADATFQTIIREMTDALEALHRSQILHLDLKPSNILIRSLRPLNLILTDFGISTLLDSDQSRQITTTKGTPMYWAPEQLGNIVGKEADYWALGVIAIEILNKHHPFEGLNHNLILSTLSSRGILVPDETPAAYRILLKGLLTRNPKKRWGYKQVMRWLDGDRSIPVFYEEEPKPIHQTGKGYEFRDNWYYTLPDLLSAFIENPDSWDDAKRHLGRGYLNRWLEATDQYTKAIEVEKFFEEYKDDDERLLYLAARFNNEIEFTLFGRTINLSGLIHYLGSYLRREQDSREDKILSLLFSGEIERIYLTFSSLAELDTANDPMIRVFEWLKKSLRGTSEKKKLYYYIKTLKDQFEIGPLLEWNGQSIIRIFEIRNRFISLGADEDADKCLQDLNTISDYALKSEIGDPDLLVACAAVMEELGRNDERDNCLKKAFGVDIKVISLLFSKRSGISRYRHYSDLVRIYETTISAESPDPWAQPSRFWQDLFFKYLQKREYELALAASERYIALEWMNGEGWAMRGLCLEKLGRKKEAEFFFASKLLKQRESPIIWVLSGEFEEGRERYESALSFYTKALDTDLTWKLPQYGIIRIYILQKKFNEASELCSALLSNNPHDQNALLYQGDILYVSGQKSAASKIYLDICQNDPDWSEACMKHAQCLVVEKSYEEAEKVVNRILMEEAKNPQLLRMKAFISIKRGKVKEAIRYLDLSLSIDPENSWAIKAKDHIMDRLQKKRRTG